MLLYQAGNTEKGSAVGRGRAATFLTPAGWMGGKLNYQKRKGVGFSLLPQIDSLFILQNIYRVNKFYI